jgi:LPS-assembly lipoprotein
MLLSRRLFAAAALVLLAGCGFSPVHAPGGAGSGLGGTILVEEPDNRNEFSFVARLEERLGLAQAPTHLLNYTIDTRSEGVGITPEQETTRYNVFGTVEYEIVEAGTGRVVHRGKVENFTGYSATSLIVGTQSVTRDANERLMVILADQVVARLIATARDWR